MNIYVEYLGLIKYVDGEYLVLPIYNVPPSQVITWAYLQS